MRSHIDIVMGLFHLLTYVFPWGIEVPSVCRDLGRIANTGWEPIPVRVGWPRTFPRDLLVGTWPFRIFSNLRHRFRATKSLDRSVYPRSRSSGSVCWPVGKSPLVCCDTVRTLKRKINRHRLQIIVNRKLDNPIGQ